MHCINASMSGIASMPSGLTTRKIGTVDTDEELDKLAGMLDEDPGELDGGRLGEESDELDEDPGELVSGALELDDFFTKGLGRTFSVELDEDLGGLFRREVLGGLGGRWCQTVPARVTDGAFMSMLDEDPGEDLGGESGGSEFTSRSSVLYGE